MGSRGSSSKTPGSVGPKPTGATLTPPNAPTAPVGAVGGVPAVTVQKLRNSAQMAQVARITGRDKEAVQSLPVANLRALTSPAARAAVEEVILLESELKSSKYTAGQKDGMRQAIALRRNMLNQIWKARPGRPGG